MNVEKPDSGDSTPDSAARKVLSDSAPVEDRSSNVIINEMREGSSSSEFLSSVEISDLNSESDEGTDNRKAEGQTVDDRVKSLEKALPSVNDLKNPEQFLKDAVDTADRLSKAGPEELKSEFQKSIADSWENHPDADYGYFTKAVTIALHQSDSELYIINTQPTGLATLKDARGLEEGESAKTVAVEFMGGEMKENFQQDKLAFETAKSMRMVADDSRDHVEPGKRENFDQALSMSLSEFEEKGLVSGDNTEKNSREMPENASTEEQQKEALKEKFQYSMADTKDPDSVVSDIVEDANKIAFADPSNVAVLFSSSMQEFSRSHPDVELHQYGKMLSSALNEASQSRDYSFVNEGSTIRFGMLRDRRMATEGNPRGTVGMDITDIESGDKETGRAAFETARIMVSQLSDASRRLGQVPGQMKPSEFRDMTYANIMMMEQ